MPLGRLHRYRCVLYTLTQASTGPRPRVAAGAEAERSVIIELSAGSPRRARPCELNLGASAGLMLLNGDAGTRRLIGSGAACGATSG